VKYEWTGPKSRRADYLFGLFSIEGGERVTVTITGQPAFVAAVTAALQRGNFRLATGEVINSQAFLPYEY
jgi:hypothetical protein